MSSLPFTSSRRLLGQQARTVLAVGCVTATVAASMVGCSSEPHESLRAVEPPVSRDGVADEGTSPASASGSSPSEPTKPSQCDLVTAVTPRLTVLQPERIAGQMLDYEVIEDEFTACAPLSWQVVRASAGGDVRTGVLWFRDGKLVNDPHPVLLPGVDSVRRIDDHSAEVVYLVEGADDPTQQPGKRVPAPEGFIGAPVQVSTVFAPAKSVTIAMNEMPARANDQAVQVTSGSGSN